MWVLQGSKLEYWSTIQQEHSKALSGAVEALEAAVLRLPVDEGVKVWYLFLVKIDMIFTSLIREKRKKKNPNFIHYAST